MGERMTTKAFGLGMGAIFVVMLALNALSR
jgi:hypothetical protein